MLTLQQIFPENKNIYSHIIKYEDIDLHNHNFFEFFYVYKGSAKHHLNGKVSVIKAGDTFLLTPADIHTFIKTDDDFMHRDIVIKKEYFEKICHMYSPVLYREITEHQSFDSLRISNELMTKIESVAPLLNLTQTNSIYTSTEFYIVTQIINILIEVINTSPKNYPQWLATLINDLHNPDNFMKNSEEFIENIGYCKEHIRRAFKKYIGFNITDYFNNIKLEYAYSLLTRSNNSIEQITEKIGISNISHFYHLFKKKYNTTPKKIRDESNINQIDNDYSTEKQFHI